MSTLTAGDLFVVQRNNQSFKLDADALKQNIGNRVVVNSIPPQNPKQGDLWWNTIEANLFIWYADGSSQQWVDASPGLAGAFSNVIDEDNDYLIGLDYTPTFDSTAIGGSYSMRNAPDLENHASPYFAYYAATISSTPPLSVGSTNAFVAESTTAVGQNFNSAFNGAINALADPNEYVNWNFYASGTAPNYFRGYILGGGDDFNNHQWYITEDGRSNITTTRSAKIVTDEENDTVEVLVDIIQDLRTRIAKLEADHATLMSSTHTNNGY